MEAQALNHLKSKYKDRMLMLAFTVAGWSPEPEGRRHGCVIAMKGKYIVATGFNGPDRYHEQAKDCGGSCCVPKTVHAEVNALLNLGEVTRGILLNSDKEDLVAYMTKKPCEDCFKTLVGIGVKAMFWLQACSGAECYWTKAQGDKLDGYGEYAEKVGDHAGHKGKEHRAGEASR